MRKIKLTSKFMTSQPGLQTISIHIIPNVSQSKYKQTMKFGQLIDYLKKLYMRSKQVVYSLVSMYFDSPQLAIK